MSYEDIVRTGIAAADDAARVLARYFERADLEVEAKAQHDFVSEADRRAEEAIVRRIRQAHPDHRILSEEAGLVTGGAGELQWIVDPLDGTTNFLQGLPIYGVSLACREGDVLVAAVISDPQGGHVYTASRGGGAYRDGLRLRVSGRPGLEGAFLATGYPFKARETLDTYLDLFRGVFLEAKAIRRCGAAALDLANTAAGVFDGFFEFRLSPWDIAAGALLIREAGGVVTDLDGGDRFLETGNVLAGSEGVHGQLREVVGRFTSEADLGGLTPMAP